jgi:hypothetical protein
MTGVKSENEGTKQCQMKEKGLSLQPERPAVTFGFQDLPTRSISTQAESKEPRRERAGGCSSQNWIGF